MLACACMPFFFGKYQIDIERYREKPFSLWYRQAISLALDFVFYHIYWKLLASVRFFVVIFFVVVVVWSHIFCLWLGFYLSILSSLAKVRTWYNHWLSKLCVCVRKRNSTYCHPSTTFLFVSSSLSSSSSSLSLEVLFSHWMSFFLSHFTRL